MKREREEGKEIFDSTAFIVAMKFYLFDRITYFGYRIK